MQSARIASVAFVGVLAMWSQGADALTLTGPTGKQWDVNDTTDGSVMWGSSSTFYYTYELIVNGIEYNAGGTSTSIIGGRGMAMRQHYISSELTVQRTAWVPDTGSNDYLRWYDMFENGSSSPVDVTARYDGELWYSNNVSASSSGDTTVDVTDTWFSCAPSYSSSMPNGHVFYDTSALNPTALALTSGYYPTATFEFTVPPMSRVAIVIFLVQMNTALEATVTSEWLATLPMEALTGLSTMDMMAILNWQAGGAPVITLVTETLEVDEGKALDLEVAVEDLEGDSFDVTWDLDGDGDFDDATGLTATFDAAGYDGPETAIVSIKSDDGTNERIKDLVIDVLNAAPEFISEPEGLTDGVVVVSRGQTWEYTIEADDPANVTGSELDPIVVTVEQRPTGSIFYGDLRIEWTVPDDDSVVGDHPVIIQADDREGGIGEQSFVLRVLENSPPSEPTIVSPNRSIVSVTRPEFVVTNATDIDGDPLIYNYQVSSTPDFSTAGLVAAGNRMQNPAGQTTWTSNADLEDSIRYYWRVWANDGRQDGVAASTYFDVDLSAAADPDMDTSTDAETDTSDYILPGPEKGCSISATTATGEGTLVIVVMALLAMCVVAFRKNN